MIFLHHFNQFQNFFLCSLSALIDSVLILEKIFMKNLKSEVFYNFRGLLFQCLFTLKIFKHTYFEVQLDV